MASTDQNRPNILFILSDDQGPWAMNCSGTEELISPNLNRLSETGIRFENFFCASPVCSPARATILTGQMPSQHGVQDFLRSGNSEELSEEDKSIQYIKGIPTYIELLKERGYSTALSGKWHLGDSVTPQAGFDFWDVFATGSGDYYKSPMFKDGKLYEGDGYISDVITDNAIKFLDEQFNEKKPFSLNVHYTAPHAPWDRHQHPKDVYDDYFKNCKFESVDWESTHPNHLSKEGASGSIGHTKLERRQILSGYFSAITEMDKNIGRLLDWLEEKKLRDNTLIIFTSDNGMNMGHHGIWGKGNGTYPPNMFDTSVKVPTIISMPNHLPQDIVNFDLLSHYDLMPTILEFSNIEHSENHQMPGKSFKKLIQGSKKIDQKPIMVYDEYGQTRMIPNNNHKYIHRYNGVECEFYNLMADPKETKNEINNPDFAEIIIKMKRQLFDWFKNYSKPEHDGSKQLVKGRGQLDIINSNREAFAQDVTFLLK